MKKFFYALSLFGIFFIFSTPVLAACSWETELTTSTSAGPGMTPVVTVSGGCKAKSLIKDSDSKCTATKPVFSTNSGKTSVCCCTEVLVASADSAPLLKAPDFLVSIPGMKALSTVNCEPGSNGGYFCEIPWLGEYVVGLYSYALSIAGILAAIMLMAGGLIWLISAGDASKITQAKEIIIGSITGLIILAASFIILLQINPDLIKMKSIAVNGIKKLVLYDADVTVIGGENPYGDACGAAKKGDFSICRALGNSQPSTLVSLENEQADSAVAKKYLAAMECVKEKNGKYLFAVNEGWRSAATQLQYYSSGKAAATPCCSNHGSGKSLDLKRLDSAEMSWTNNVNTGLTACMNTQGLYANLSSRAYNEPWHWSLTGK
ncbi:MAG: hypothetical protein WCN88_04130 [Candidatus Falkowbacteria bacterium]